MQYHFNSSVGRALSGLLLLILVAGCSSNEPEAYVERPVEELYNQALADLNSENYFEAAKGFDEVERQHPYSVWSTKAQIMSAFAYYQSNEYDQAILAAERFIELHPGNKDVAYAYYLVAISYYEQITGVERDQKVTRQALDALQNLVRRFPNTEYAQDARLKIDLTRDHLAGKEMAIGRYYLGQKYMIGAINRFRIVVEQYQTTTHVPEALHRLTEAYLTLGITEEAQTAAAVLGYNFPGSEWYQDSYALLDQNYLKPVANEDSWIVKAWKSVF
ncbi:outer membrane protein assembly factor BamD [Sneathiella sp. CAU 1612]|uniref:Outer membrane protein assembly factor BamD n=1 Tax=Sneathiella sedimenti TaxID=2816034 RepID=A0ABS3F6Q9_9PROT|nr:outer membrane protein assembly factor BamD [Sneathiella sedimenti]MBO0334215.1 outer membrane protein assembly factor BamD [Sneathiella sedimenti]